MGCLRLPARNSSSLLRVNFTGRPVFLAMNAAQNSQVRNSIFPPKPPPIKGLITRISFSRIPSVEARRHCTMYGTWVDVQSVIRPSRSTWARAEQGSR